ncbi:unnamed protein product [Meganyctiphanes norvegica]|uniref:Major facilitator superfamily (MFS) profile domain-containing protein n=1 Tax=Meganyctiphanes norvegica TaxID=48144 RepID=A0AAV2PKC7_MEGNR
MAGNFHLSVMVPLLGSSLPLGYGLGIMNSPQIIIRKWIQETLIIKYDLHLTEHQEVSLWAIIVSIFLVGSMIGAVMGAPLVHRIGRRRSFLLNHMNCLIGSMVFVFSKYFQMVEMLLIGRFVLGISAGLAGSIVPLYLSEVSPKHLNGVMAVMHRFALTMGMTLSMVFGMEVVIGTEDHWPYLACVTAACALMAICLHPLMIESPVYSFIVLKDNENGQSLISHLHKGHDKIQIVKEEKMKMVKDLNETESNKKGESELKTKEVLRSSSLRLQLIIISILFINQPFSGMNGCVAYANIIFRSAGLSQRHSEMASIFATTINCLMSIVSMPLIKKLSRRCLLFSSMLGCILCLATLLTSLNYISSVSHVAAYIAIAAFITYFIFYAYGIGAIPFVVAAELLPPNAKPVIMSLGNGAYWTSTLLASVAFPILQKILGEFSLLCFIAPCILNGIFFYYFLPETLKSVE